MTATRTLWRIMVAAGTVVVLVAGCGDDDDDAATATTEAAPVPSAAASAVGAGTVTTKPSTTVTVEASSPPVPTDAPNGTTDDPTAGTAVSEPPPRPAIGSCQPVEATPDGLYLVADAGTAIVEQQGNRLIVGEVVPADGWTHAVEVESEDEVDVDFRMGELEVWLEVELRGGEVRAQICADD
jgi:hypothetical protein